MQLPVVPPPGLPCPLSVYTVAHTLVAVLQVNEVHAVGVPQSLSTLQAQLPAASHASVKSGPQAVPLGRSSWDGAPLIQTPVEHRRAPW